MKTYDNKSSGCLTELFQWIRIILVSVILAILLRAFVIEPVFVDGPSMQDTLSTGNRLIVYKLGYYFAHPQNGDIIVIKIKEGSIDNLPFIKSIPFLIKAIPIVDEVDYIKRVIGVPGDTIDIKDGYVYINGKKLIETYAKGATDSAGLTGSMMIPENKVYVLGDNRKNSRDSRQMGLIDINKIKGKAVLRIWPLDEFGSIY